MALAFRHQVWLVAVGLSITVSAPQAAEPVRLVPEMVRQKVSNISSLISPSLGRNWPPVVILNTGTCIAIGTQPEMSLGVCLTALRGLPGESLLVMGAPRLDNAARNRGDGGAVFSLRRDAVSGQVTLGGMLESSRGSAIFGQSIAPMHGLKAGDPDGLLVGAPNYAVTRRMEGAWFWHPGPGPWSGDAVDPMSSSGVQDGKLGISVAMAGDVNGDGWNDVIVGARNFGSGEWREGAAFVYLGHSDGIERRAVWSAVGGERLAHYGAVVASAGDVNADGFDDILVSSPRYSKIQPDAGRVYLYLGGPGGPETEAAWVEDGPVMGGLMGTSAVSLGDVNGDGFADVAIGIPGAIRENRGGNWSGAVNIYLGTTDGLTPVPAMILRGTAVRSNFGFSLAARGDVNGDKIPDLLVGAPSRDGEIDNSGAVVLFLGTRRGFAETPAWLLEGDQSGGQCGGDVAWVPDCNNDGCDEILVASPRYTSVRSREGRVDFLLGSPKDYTSTNRVPVLALALPPGQVSARANSLFWARAVWLVGLSGLGAVAVLGSLLWTQRRRQARSAVDAERQRLARELHDQLGPQLTRLALLGDGPGDAPTADRPGGTPDPAVARAAREAIDTMRQLVWATNPANDSLEKFANFLSAYASDYLSPTTTRLELDVPLELPAVAIRSEVRHHLLLVVQEALHNAVRHGQAGQLHLRLRYDDGCLTIMVEDDGRGFAGDAGRTEARPRGGGQGLGNMRHRVKEIGGTFTVQSSPGRGTIVTVTLAL
jgi:signal transduction histidine kinase